MHPVCLKVCFTPCCACTCPAHMWRGACPMLYIIRIAHLAMGVTASSHSLSLRPEVTLPMILISSCSGISDRPLKLPAGTKANSALNSVMPSLSRAHIQMHVHFPQLMAQHHTVQHIPVPAQHTARIWNNFKLHSGRTAHSRKQPLDRISQVLSSKSEAHLQLS